ncbi:MAG: hypothetical protein ABJC66_13360 [Gammaproteobacteria bacterium]
MKANSPLKQQDFAESPPESSDAIEAAAPTPMQACDAARSRQNIEQWSSYLPADCVKAMISMGWDVNT